jgi:O-antigen/teichoic acid export membrane protein
VRGAGAGRFRLPTPGRRARRFAGYAAVRAVVEGLLALRGIGFGAILGVEAFGVWSLFRITCQYSGFAGLGTTRGVEVEVSACGPDQATKAEAIGRAASGFLMVVFGTVGLLAAAAAVLLPAGVARSVAIGVAAGALVEKLWLYGLSYLRARGRLWTYARLELAHAAISLCLGLALAYAFGLYGAFAGFLLSHLASLALLRHRAPFRPLLSWDDVRPLLRIGLPLSISQFLSTVLLTVDRLVVGALLGVGALGVYAFAVAVSGIGTALGVAVRTVIFPDLFRRARTEGAPGTIAAHLGETVLPFAWLLAPVLGLFALAIEPVLTLVLPAFVAAAAPARIFVFAGVAQGLVSLGMLGLIAADRQPGLPRVTLAALLINLALSVAALRFGLGLTGLAAAALLCRLGFAVAILLLALGPRSLRAAARLALAVMLPILACALLVWGLGDRLALAEPKPFALAVGIYVGAIAPFAAFSLRGRLPRRR